MTPLTLERARTIVAGAEDYLDRRAMDSSPYVAFRHAGAASRIEALHALLLVLADYFQLLPEGDSHARAQFDNYARLAESIALSIAHDTDDAIEDSARLGKLESVGTFVSFLKSLEPDASSYWADVHRRIGLAEPAGAPKKKAESLYRSLAAMAAGSLAGGLLSGLLDTPNWIWFFLSLGGAAAGVVALGSSSESRSDRLSGVIGLCWLIALPIGAIGAYFGEVLRSYGA